MAAPDFPPSTGSPSQPPQQRVRDYFGSNSVTWLVMLVAVSVALMAWLLANPLPKLVLFCGVLANGLLILLLRGNRRYLQQIKSQAAELHQSRERFRTLVENLPGIVFRCEIDYPWHVQHISNAIERYTGVAASDFMSHAHNYGEFIYPDDLPRVQEAVALGVSRHQTYDVEYRLRHRDGRLYWVNERGQAIYDAQGQAQYLDGVIIDISASKQAIQDLQTLTDSLPLAVYRYRLEPDGRPNMLYLSAAAAALFDVPVAAALADPKLLFATIHPDDLAGLAAADRFASEHSLPFRYETRVRHADGSERWLYLSSSPHPMANGQIAYNGFIEDITDRKRNAELLQENEARYRRIVETATEGIWSIDGQHLTTFVNVAMQQMLGYSEADMLGKAVEDFIFEEDLALHRQQMAERHNGQDGRYERRFRRKDGSECWCLISTTVLHDNDGHFTGSFAMFSDITAIKHAEREVAERESLLKQIFDTSSVAIFLVDKAGIIVHANQRMAEMFGCPLPQLIGSTYTSHVHPSERISGQQQMLALLNSSITSVDLERRYWRADGSEFWGHLTGKRFLDVQGNEMGLVGVIADISQRRKIEDELRIAATTFQIQDGLVVTNAAGVIVRVNAAFSEVSGYSQEEAIGQTPAILHSGEHEDSFYREMWATLLSEGKWQGEIWNRRKNGEIFPEWLTITAVRDADNRISHYVGAYRDITEHKAAEEAIRNLAFYDPLTTLPNRRLLLDRLHQGMAASSRNGLHGALIFIDLDNFKTLNDTLGHDLGDLLLVEVSKRLQHSVREGDTVARLGGDEFVIMLAGLHPAVEEAVAQAEAVGHNIIQTLNPPFHLGKHELRSTPSIGITLFKGNTHSVDELLKRADLAMYQAKAAGRNTLRFFDPAMQASINARMVMENELYRAIEAGEFALHYQPQLDMAGHICGVEALIRWQNPKRGMVSPAEFIPVAEETGQILPIGHWVLMQACEQLLAWRDNPLTAQLSISVNVSAKQFRLPMFVDEVRNLIRHTGIDPTRLKLELTESMLLIDVNDAIVKMTALQGLGLSFALDDFGTGYSSLAYLKKLPLDQVKIDQSFVRDVLTDPNDTAICRAVIALGKSLGLAVIAEGVETTSQRDFLLAEGCDFAQGYLFAKPMPAVELIGWLQRPQSSAISTAAVL